MGTDKQTVLHPPNGVLLSSKGVDSDLHNNGMNGKGIMLSERHPSQRVKVCEGWGMTRVTINSFLGVKTLLYLSVLLGTRIYTCVKIHKTVYSKKINKKLLFIGARSPK